jgi:phosphomannomutase
MDNPPKKFAGIDVVSVEDYKNSVFRNLKSGITNEINLPKTDALVINLADGSKVCLRPSGTEPKVKYYFIFDKS